MLCRPRGRACGATNAAQPLRLLLRCLVMLANAAVNCESMLLLQMHRGNVCARQVNEAWGARRCPRGRFDLTLSGDKSTCSCPCFLPVSMLENITRALDDS